MQRMHGERAGKIYRGVEVNGGGEEGLSALEIDSPPKTAQQGPDFMGLCNLKGSIMRPYSLSTCALGQPWDFYS